MWNAIANMIIKATDNINRGVENAATSSGDGNNGQNYQVSADNGSGGGGGYTPVAQDTSAVSNAAKSTSNFTDTVKSMLPGLGNKSENEKEEEAKANAASDERLKNIFGNNEDIISTFAKIKSIQFTYNDKAKEVHPNGENQVDDDLHLGVKAQDLEKNPLTASTVSEDNSGYKQVNTEELTMANSAVIAEICRRLEVIEKVLKIKVV